jgi:CubicO group peptidase (beta-lactamase class C family)
MAQPEKRQSVFMAKPRFFSFIRISVCILLIFSFGPVSASARPFKPGKDSLVQGLQIQSEKIKIDPYELAEFMDKLITERMEKYEVPSLTVSVVQDGNIIFARGYGYADIEKTVLMDAEQTLFRICSVSKLFVWTSVMQLAEQNRLDLNADVNTYLGDFQIPDTFPQPITLAHLLTHTAGFDKRDQGELENSRDQESTILEFLHRELPERVFPPGQVHIYSNYGANLAAYIVERVTGMPFHDYLEQNIFEPLGMVRSTSRQTLPPDLAHDVAIGYYWQTGFPKGEPGEFETLPPGGGITSNAIDMARFVMAHLGTEGMGFEPILKPESLDLMHATQFRFDPRLPGYTYGFFETYRNGQRLIFHDGGSSQFSANLTLIPEQNIGLFEAYTGGKKGMGYLNGDFVEHYFHPVEIEIGQPSFSTSPELKSFQGIYRTVQISRTTFEKTVKALDLGSKVTANADGTLSFQNSRWIRIEPLTFQKEGSSDLLVFQTKDRSLDGSVKYLFIDNDALEKLNWYESITFQSALLAICLLIFVMASFAWPLTTWIESKRGAQPGLSQRVGMCLSWLVCVVNIAFLLFVSIQLFRAVWFGFSTPQKILFLLPLLSLLLSAVSIVMMVLNMTTGKSAQRWERSARVYVLRVAVAGIAFTWLLNYWNLLGIPT